MLARYHGTRLGRQEIDGEIIEERAGRAVDARTDRSLPRGGGAAACMRIVVAVDPPGSARKGADACGLVAAGRAEDGTIYVLADESAAGFRRKAGRRKAIALWRRL